jgi:hypothetical protein
MLNDGTCARSPGPPCQFVATNPPCKETNDEAAKGDHNQGSPEKPLGQDRRPALCSVCGSSGPRIPKDRGARATHTTVPKTFPIPAVRAIANAPQNVTRAVARRMFAPPAFAPIAPRRARKPKASRRSEIGFGLDELTTDQLIDDAAAADRSAIDLYHFTRQLSGVLDGQGRRRIVRMMWEIIYVDGRVNEFEDNFI